MNNTAELLRERAQWELERARTHRELSVACERAAEELLKQADNAEQSKGAWYRVWL